MSHKEINKVNEMISQYFGFHPHDAYKWFNPKEKSKQYFMYRNFLLYTLTNLGTPCDALARRYGYAETVVKRSVLSTVNILPKAKCLQKKFDEIYQNIFTFEG